MKAFIFQLPNQEKVTLMDSISPSALNWVSKVFIKDETNALRDLKK
jgi:hypothetical protein